MRLAMSSAAADVTLSHEVQMPSLSSFTAAPPSPNESAARLLILSSPLRYRKCFPWTDCGGAARGMRLSRSARPACADIGGGRIRVHQPLDAEDGREFDAVGSNARLAMHVIEEADPGDAGPLAHALPSLVRLERVLDLASYRGDLLRPTAARANKIRMRTARDHRLARGSLQNEIVVLAHREPAGDDRCFDPIDRSFDALRAAILIGLEILVYRQHVVGARLRNEFLDGRWNGLGLDKVRIRIASGPDRPAIGRRPGARLRRLDGTRSGQDRRFFGCIGQLFDVPLGIRQEPRLDQEDQILLGGLRLPRCNGLENQTGLELLALESRAGLELLTLEFRVGRELLALELEIPSSCQKDGNDRRERGHKGDEDRNPNAGGAAHGLGFYLVESRGSIRRLNPPSPRRGT